MRDFTLPFKPEELLAQPGDSSKLWAQNLPPVEAWSSEDVASNLDGLIGRLLQSHGHDIAEDKSFSLLFALIQAWPRLEDEVRPRVSDILTDAARRQINEVARLKKAPTAGKKKEDAKQEKLLRDARNAAKVTAFLMRWCIEQMMRNPSANAGRRRGKGAGKASKKADDEEDKALELQRQVERQRCAVLTELLNLLAAGALPWLWSSDDADWQQVAQCTSDAGFAILDSEAALKHRETKQLALRCVAAPLLQEGHSHSNLLIATVSKLTHGLRGHELASTFAADVLLLAHSTPLPRSFLVELTQHCTPGELQSQGAFQRSLGAFLTAIAERLPHVVLANISVLLPLLDVDCYPLRSAVVESIGHLLMAEGKLLPKGAKGQGPEVPAQAQEEGGAAEGREEEAGDAGSAHFSIALATKKDLLETLAQRATDKTVWVRVRTLTTLEKLASNQRVAALPKEQWIRVLEIATKRMSDVGSSVRRAAMQLVQKLIELHPYGPAIQGGGDERAKAERVIKEVNARLKSLKEAELKEEAAAAGVEVDVEHDEDEPAEETSQPSEEPEAKRRRCTKKTVTDVTATTEVDNLMSESVEDRTKQREALNRMADCYIQRVQFVELIDRAEERLRSLLVSRTATDVTEAINVVVELRLRGLPAANAAFNQVLGLVWSRTTSVKDAAVEAFHRMHLEGRDARNIVRGLLEMYQQGCAGSWTYTHLASVQELIAQAAGQDLISPKTVVPELVAALETPSAAPMALRALTALAVANWKLMADQFPRIAAQVGPKGASVGSTAKERLERVVLLCQLLTRVHTCANVPFSEEAWNHLQLLVEHVVTVVMQHFSRGEIPAEWFGAAQAAMDLTFELHGSATGSSSPMLRCPDKLWEQILMRMMQGLLGYKPGMPMQAIQDGDAGDAPMNEVAADGAALPAPTAVAKDNYPELSAPQLGCLVFLSGHLALRMLVFLESLQSALKKKRLAEEDKKMADAREKKKEKAEQAQGKKKKGGGKGKQQEEEEQDESTSMGMANQEERETEFFAEIAEFRLLYSGKSLLDRVKPLVFSCLLKPTLRCDPILRRLAAISLCKFMTVSKKFAQENLDLLFSVLFPQAGGPSLFADASAADLDAAASRSSNELLEDLTLRQSLLVAVGDLLFRHPNIVEPKTERLYAALGGSSGKKKGGEIELRLTALLVLTHLVLNDMLKPRTPLLTRALWLTACTHEPTARVARILFQELSKRTSNVVYNLLPEIIARLPEFHKLAGGVSGKPEDRVRYVMQFIEKEKQIEGLIEKLSGRLEQAAEVASKGKKALEGIVPTEKLEEAAAEDGDALPTKGFGAETVACLATALGSMTYTDRCILRLHDVVVTRKAINNSIAYQAVVRQNLMNIVEKTRAARKAGGKDKGGDAAPAEPVAPPPAGGDADGAAGGGKAAAISAALEAIESTVNKLGVTGKDKEKEEPKVKDEATMSDVKEEAADEKPAEKAADKGEAAAERPKRGRGGAKKAAQEGGVTLPVVEEVEKKGRGRPGKKNDQENSPPAENEDEAGKGAAKEAPKKAAKAAQKAGMSGAELRAAMASGAPAKKRRVAQQKAMDDDEE
eukprot:TRINITY_DN24433_c0_g3_i1.p1 TRINITY_DN24433_c0_g3~~TRINITY_DN24433_c0_g3_i1.p1  ORF type:complete len:1585 (-),score=575.68 TRINITY_DN24433_c0_g3_i1:333-5087(-)